MRQLLPKSGDRTAIMKSLGEKGIIKCFEHLQYSSRFWTYSQLITTKPASNGQHKAGRTQTPHELLDTGDRGIQLSGQFSPADELPGFRSR